MKRQTADSCRVIANIEESPRHPGPDADAMAALVATELQNLSLEERQIVYEDLHGVTAIPEEKHDLLAVSMKEYHEAISRIRVKTAYDKAVFLNPKYVLDPKFALMFLRADDYDPKKAASRATSYFTHKMELFGIDKLVTPITFDDLDEDDQVALLSGYFQKLPLPDRSGRVVLITSSQCMHFASAVNMVRAIWYLLMSFIQDNDVIQRLGCVVVALHAKFRSEFPVKALEFGFAAAFMTKALPFKIRGFHFCYDNLAIRPVMGIVQRALGTAARMRAQIHFGSTCEWKYALMSFGIPVTLLPISEDASSDLKEYLAMIGAYRQSEAFIREKQEGNQTIQFPNANDVLLGRGRPYQEFPGNLYLADIVEARREGYKALTKKDKPDFTRRIVNIIKKSSGRFLKKSEDGGEWIEVDDKSARDKVGHSFRVRKPKRAGMTTPPPFALLASCSEGFPPPAADVVDYGLSASELLQNTKKARTN